MRIRVAIALFTLLGFCSVASMKSTTETRPIVVAGGSPTPCWPPGSTCAVEK
jgi:hypothetical protein